MPAALLANGRCSLFGPCWPPSSFAQLRKVLNQEGEKPQAGESDLWSCDQLCHPTTRGACPDKDLSPS